MKVVIAVMLLMAGVALGWDRVTIKPGSSMTFTPGETVRISCQGDGAYLVADLCVCNFVSDKHYVPLERHFVFSDGTKTMIKLGKAVSLDLCNVMKKSPEFSCPQRDTSGESAN